MKINQPVTDKEIVLKDDSVIVSTTDMKGCITSANEEFVRISGFTLEELIGKNHNMIRHPDMPPAAFANMWESIKQNKPWLGIVKNRCKNGDYYWVKAYVSPIDEKGKTIGYQSIRTRANAEEIRRASDLYLAIKQDKKRLFKPMTLSQRFALLIGCSVLLTALGFYFSQLFNQPWAFYAGLAVAAMCAWLVAKTIIDPIQNIAKTSRKLVDNPLCQEVITGRRDAFGTVLLAANLQQAKLFNLKNRASQAIVEIETSAHEVAHNFDATMKSVNNQRVEIDQVAAAINQMSATVEEVAQNINSTAEAAHTAKKEVGVINREISETIGIIMSLENEMQDSVEVINRLAENSQNIGAVLDVIQNIAEQTNLLALNAAIEAARAGEAGRGFAVVADEVRTLATRTAESTQEIEKIIEQIQTAASDAVSTMDLARKRAEESSDHVEKTAESISGVTQAVEAIDSMSTQISSAAEEQSAVSHEINRSIHKISENVADTVSSAEKSAEAASIFSDLAADLQKVVQQSN